MEPRPPASTSTDLVTPLAASLSSTAASSAALSSLPSAPFSSLPDSRSFISLEELIDCDEDALLAPFAAPPDSSPPSASLLKALKPNHIPFPSTTLPPSETDKAAADSKPPSPLAQLHLLVKPASERRAASVLIPATSSSSSSAPTGSAFSFDSSLVFSDSETARASSDTSALAQRTQSAVVPASSVSLPPRKRPAKHSPPFSPTPSSDYSPSFSSALVPSPFSRAASPPASAQPVVPAWSTHSTDAASHLASHRLDQAVFSYLLGIRSAPFHPYCRQQLLQLLLSQLRLHPSSSLRATHAMSSPPALPDGSDLDREVSLIDSLDNEDDMLSEGSRSDSEQTTDADDDEDMGIVCRINVAGRAQMLRQHDEQRLYGEQPAEKQPESTEEEGTKDEQSSSDDDSDKSCGDTASEKGEGQTGEQRGKAKLLLRMLHSYPRSLASILPQPLASATAPAAVADNDEDEDDVDFTENKEDYDIRLAAISYLSPDIACGLCGLFLYRPVTAMCGHSFCQLCLSVHLDRQPVSALASLQCPYPKCAETLVSSRAVCVQLASTLEKCFPTESAMARMHSEAISAVSGGKDEEAITFLTSALVSWPDAFPLYSARLCCYLRLCQFDMAMLDLKQCIELTQPTAVKQAAGVPSPTDKPRSSPLPPFHQRTAAVQSLTALGQAGLLTRFYRLAVYSFASALRLSGATNESSIVNREKVAQSLIDAYLANVNAVLSDMGPAPVAAAAAVEEKQSERSSSSSSSSGVRHISSRSLMPAKSSLPPSASSSSSTSARASGWFANALSSTSTTRSASPSVSSSSAHSASSSSSSSSSKSISPNSQSLSPSLTSFFLPITDPSAMACHLSPLPAPRRRRQEPYRLMVDHPTPSLVSGECLCLVCMELLYEPVTTVCGHTFCRLCLARSLDHKNLCPFCRVSLSVHISPTRQHVNVAIKTLLQRWCEGRYERRHARVTAALQEQASYLPMFVCTLMFPGVRCPLHIYEPRYRLMIRSVLESGYNRFGMVVHTDGMGGYGAIGCTSEIRNVRLLSDGRSLVDTVGGQRFRVLERGVRNGYDVARVEWLHDISAEEEQRLYGRRSPSTAQLQAEVFRLVHDMLLPRLVNRFDLEAQLGEMPSMAEDSARFAYWLCAVLPLRMDEKYAFLQLDSSWHRYSTLYVALKRLEERSRS